MIENAEARDMPKSAAHIRRHLRASQPISALLDEIEQRERLSSALRQRLPAELAKHCCQAALSAGELTLFVDSPVWVDRFRFLCPELIGSDLVSGLALVETEVTTCKVRVLPRTSGLLSQPPSPEIEPGRESAVQASAGDNDLTCSALSQALARLARTLGQSQP